MSSQMFVGFEVSFAVWPMLSFLAKHFLPSSYTD